MSNGPIISTISSGTLSLQSTKSDSAKVDSQKVSETNKEASPSSAAPNDTVSTKSTDNNSSALSSILDGISQSIQTVEVAQESADKILNLLERGLNLATQATEYIVPPNAEELSSLKIKFNNILRQISKIVDDSGYRGINLLKGDVLHTAFGENARNNISTEGLDASAKGLGIDEANFSSAQSIEDTSKQVSAAIKSIESFLKALGEDDNLIKTRQDFAKESIGSIENAPAPVDTDEGANLLALQIGQQLAQLDGGSLASGDQKDLLRLF